jgi:aspartyl-tRNA(Asn)/glutamyl-tRNA(Gln) amidotransferase subunit B
MREKNLSASQLHITPKALAQIIHMVDEGKVNAATGKLLVSKVNVTGQSPAEIVANEGLGAVSDDSALLALIDAVITASPKEVESFRAGKKNLLGWFLGQVMQRTGGRADPKRTRELMLKRLKA